MGAREARGGPAKLSQVRQQLERWRRTRKGRGRIPEPLWAAAVKVANTVGLHRTAKTLRLDYYTLKKRAEEDAVANERPRRKADASARRAPAEAAGTTFLEVPPAVWTGPGECTMELEDAGGARLRVHVKGLAAADLAELSRSFWQRGS